MHLVLNVPVAIILILTWSISSAQPATGNSAKNIIKVTHDTIELNKTIEADVGNPVYFRERRKIEYRVRARIGNSIDLPLVTGHNLKIREGTESILQERENGDLILCYTTTGPGQTFTMLGGGKGIGCLVDVNRDSTFDAALFATEPGNISIPSPVPYEMVSETKIAELESFRIELLYQGRQGQTLTFTYREFSKDFARPAFAQNVTYPIGDDNAADIGFKGARIRIQDLKSWC